MLSGLEGTLDGRQHAYRGSRGAEAHLLELLDFVQEEREAGSYVYKASVDVDNAFDTVPHGMLMRTAENLGVSPHVCRYLHNWLKKRLICKELFLLET